MASDRVEVAQHRPRPSRSLAGQAQQVVQHAHDDRLLGRPAPGALRAAARPVIACTCCSASSRLSGLPPSKTSISCGSPFAGTCRTTKCPGRPTPTTFRPSRRASSMYSTDSVIGRPSRSSMHLVEVAVASGCSSRRRLPWKPRSVNRYLFRAAELRLLVGVLRQAGGDLRGHALDLLAVGLDVQLVVVQPGDQQGGVEQVDVLVLAAAAPCASSACTLLADGPPGPARGAGPPAAPAAGPARAARVTLAGAVGQPARRPVSAASGPSRRGRRPASSMRAATSAGSAGGAISLPTWKLLELGPRVAELGQADLAAGQPGVGRLDRPAGR